MEKTNEQAEADVIIKNVVCDEENCCAECKYGNIPCEGLTFELVESKQIEQLPAEIEKHSKDRVVMVGVINQLEEEKIELQAEIDGLKARRPMTLEEARVKALWACEKRRVLAEIDRLKAFAEHLVERFEEGYLLRFDEIVEDAKEDLKG